MAKFIKTSFCMKFILSKWSTILLTTATLIMLWGASSIQFNFSFEKFFPKNNPDVQFYQEFKNNFEDDSRFLLLGIKNQQSIYDSTFLSRIDSLTKTLQKDTFLTQVYSPTNARRVKISPFGPQKIKLLRYSSSQKLSTDSSYLANNNHFKNNFISEDGNSVCLTLKVINKAQLDETAQLLDRIRATCKKQNFSFHLAGKLVAEQIYIAKTREELTKFSLISVFLIILFLVLTYRSFWLLIIPLVVIGLSVVWAIGLMSYTGKGLDLLMSLMPSIMFVVGMSDVIHFLSKYIEELRKGHQKTNAIKATVSEIGTATLLTSLTTAIGFFTLYFIEIAPIREFGIYIGMGVLFAFIITILLLPTFLKILPTPQIAKTQKKQHNWNNFLNKVFVLIFNNKVIVSISFITITIAAVIGIQHVKINSKLIDDLKPNDPLKIDFLFFEKQFFGTRPFEMVLYKGDESSSFFDYKTQNELNKITTYLEEEYGVKNTVSPLTLTKTINQSLHQGSYKYYKLPTEQSELKKINKYIKRLQKRPEYKLILNDSLGLARLTGKLSDLGSLYYLEKNQNLQRYIDTEIDSRYLKTRITGSALLIDANNRDLAQNMMLGLSTAFVVISLIMGLLFKSTRMILIALAPNIIPLCILGGILGYGGIDLKLSTSIIFTVAFGIAVDDTIHFMSRYKMEKAKGLSKIYAIKRSFISTGKALIVTSFIISAGFMCLMLSSFMGTFYTGLFVSLTLIFALVSDLLFLPILLLLFDKD